MASGSSEQTNTVIKAGGVPKFVALLTSTYPHVAEQAVWALGNIAGDGPDARDTVLNLDCVKYLLALINPDIEVSGVLFINGRILSCSVTCVLWQKEH